MARTIASDGVLVVGLGRFGSALAQTLVDLGHEVLGVDADPDNVQHNADVLTHVVEADATDEEVMRQLGAGEFGRAVVGIGTDLEASILTTSVLSGLEVPDIWAKAITVPHGRILERVGAHHVVFPEHDMGRRVAHLVTGRIIEFVQLDEGFALVELKPPKQIVGRSLGDAQVRSRYGITVVCIKPEGGSFTYATQETVPGPDDVLVVAGETDRVEGFAQLG
ncbi:MAG TPA: TrkA family potassium uptake protein [Actinomycetota bacterium]|nr:TrkA family potassium uptake protein [Actinomycetota bacterium]